VGSTALYIAWTLYEEELWRLNTEIYINSQTKTNPHLCCTLIKTLLQVCCSDCILCLCKASSECAC